MIVFETYGKITPKDDKSNIPMDFDVPCGIQKLIIDYSYFPKEFNDESAALDLIKEKLAQYLGPEFSENPVDFLPVKNLITVSLDENGKYRGAAHRQSNKQTFEISADYASRGFLKGKPQSGRWRIVLNVHCCACDVNFKIKISGEELK
ncbi:MAG: hypothetical protein LIO43_02795 [Clostridiales bacterium]|nr:hypothetical protein [Clostridiales bacterium]